MTVISSVQEAESLGTIGTNAVFCLHLRSKVWNTLECCQGSPAEMESNTQVIIADAGTLAKKELSLCTAAGFLLLVLLFLRVPAYWIVTPTFRHGPSHSVDVAHVNHL